MNFSVHLKQKIQIYFLKDRGTHISEKVVKVFLSIYGFVVICCRNDRLVAGRILHASYANANHVYGAGEDSDSPSEGIGVEHYAEAIGLRINAAKTRALSG